VTDLATTTSDLLWDVADGIGTITLNRPHRKNAFTFEMIDAWAARLRDARTDDSVRVIVVTGAGDAFCSGVDLEHFVPKDRTLTVLERREQLVERVHRVALALEDLDKPVIAAVRGVAVGAGLDMALMCDMRIAAESARMAEGYVKVGLVPGDGGCYWLPRVVGLPKALELLLSGDTVDAREALRIGMVNKVVPDEGFTDAVRGFAARFASAPPVTARLIKRATYQSARSDLRTALDLIGSHTAVVTQTEDTAEALAAFVERRPAQYKGR
jgi:enoyl-CoA hydratase/carnithine racemase